tara:strand:- start:654 stop:866 length:213 start_codon:yes stop_codon:yes gene_type:complete
MVAEFLLFFYGLVAAFVLMSIERNHREGREHGRHLALAGWSVMSMSACLAVLLMFVAALALIGYAPTIAP